MIERTESKLAARGFVDREMRLLNADEPLARLHEECGGSLPGVLAVPELRNLVEQSLRMGLRLGRDFSAFDGSDLVTGFVRIQPADEEEGGGCEIFIENWQRHRFEPLSSRDLAIRLDEIDRASAEISARLDADQSLLYILTDAADARGLQEAIEAEPKRHWTEYLQIKGVSHKQPLHWRLLDGSECELPGSERSWRIRILPVEPGGSESRGFELLLLANRPLVDTQAQEQFVHSQLVGSSLTPVLRRPIARIVANAETIRTRLAGPLRREYSDYAGNISLAAQHLGAMLDDLADIETLEAPDFMTAREKVDLEDAARRAAGILGVRAQSKTIEIDVRGAEANAVAEADFRRVLQILINLIGNAIAYSPEESTISVTFGAPQDDMVAVTVSDQGPGVSDEQASRIFDKFERLGRDSEGGRDPGSGLGLYISRRLARAMGGEVSVAPAKPGGNPPGAAFTLSLPAASS